MKFRSLVFSALLCGAAHVNATVLTFDITPTPGAGSVLPQDYGDRGILAGTGGSYSYGLAGGLTPGITISYGGGSVGSLNFWTTGYSDLTNVVENEADGDNLLRVSFDADPGSSVRLDSFDIGNWGGAVNLAGISVTNQLGTTLFSSGLYPLSGSGSPHQSVSFAGGLFGQQLNLLVDLTGLGSGSDNIGLDNIQFGQVASVAAIPEPSTYALMLAGLGVVGFVARRRRKREPVAL